MKPRVVLVHGLWMNGAAMLPMARRIAACGYTVYRFPYRSVRRPVEENARRLNAYLRARGTDGLHLVGHSLGGLVILHALAARDAVRVRRVVLVGTPVRGSLAGSGLARFAFGRLLLGASRPLWAGSVPPSVPADVQIGVIAGGLALGLGRLFARLPVPNDGVVSEAETRMPQAADSIRLTVNHTGMLFSARVTRQICAFLQDGRFARD